MNFVERDKIKNRIGRIASKRARLREISYAGSEMSTRKDVEEEFIGLLREINDLINNIQRDIEHDHLTFWDSHKNFEADQGARWSLGAEEIRGPIIPFLRGNLEPVKSVVVAPKIPDNVVALFLSIPGLRELLKRENHGHWGYHYHYLDAKGRRSDTLLTFARQLKTLPDGGKVKVVTWERHSETSHFKARASTWGAKKRESVHQACIGDSAGQDLNDFKRQARDAEVLWPV